MHYDKYENLVTIAGAGITPHLIWDLDSGIVFAPDYHEVWHAGVRAFIAVCQCSESGKDVEYLGTVTELANENHKMLAFLIFFFAIVVPVTKTLLLSLGLIFPGKPLGQKSSRIVFYIGKWAMADVFVVGITIALMTVKSHVMVQAEARSGLYVFAAYVILSTLAAQLSVLAARVQESGSQASL